MRIGKKEIETMITLHSAGMLQNAAFIVDGIFSTDEGKSHDYYSEMTRACESEGWRFKVAKNHSKVILMQTKAGNYYVLETSSNLNENPKIEQFSFENDKQLYDFYWNFYRGGVFRWRNGGRKVRRLIG